MSKERAVLADRLGVPEGRLEPLEELGAGDISRLDLLVAKAMTAGDEAFEQGVQDALRFVPRPLRGAARALLFPEGGRG